MRFDATAHVASVQRVDECAPRSLEGPRLRVRIARNGPGRRAPVVAGPGDVPDSGGVEGITDAQQQVVVLAAVEAIADAADRIDQ